MPDISSIGPINNIYPSKVDKQSFGSACATKKPADSFQKSSATAEAAALGTASALAFSAVKMPHTVNKVFADFKGQGIPKKVKIAGIAAGGALATAAYVIAGTGIGAACGGVIDAVNNKSHKQNPVADNKGLSAEVSDSDSERPALIDGDFEPENTNETNENNNDIKAEGASKK